MHDLPSRLENARRACQRQLAVAFLLRALKYAAAALLGLFLLDLIVQLGATWRAGLVAAYLICAAALGAWALYLARGRHGNLEKTARLLESRDASLGSKLINFLQLRQSLEAQPPLTRRLTEIALADYASRLSQLDLNPLTRLPELAHYQRRTVLALGLCAVALACFFPISKVEMLRFADPFGDHPPYSLTRLEITEPAADGAVVTYNQGLVVKVKTAGHLPRELYLSFYDPAKPAEVRTVPMFSKGELGFLQEVAGVRTDLLVYAHTRNNGTVSRRRLIRVGLTPVLDRAFVTITPPAYTGLKSNEAPFQFKDLNALAGSDIRFRVRSNRPLAGGSIELQAAAASPAPLPMTPSGENEVSGALTAAESGRLKFSMADPAHHVSQQDLSANLTVTHDQPPAIQIEDPAQDSFVCEDFKVDARVVATDDYGLKTVRIHRALNEHFSAPETLVYAPGTTAATEHAVFDIKDLGVQPGDVISFFAEAVDTCPDPHLVRSQTVHLMIISTDDYNNALRERSDLSDIEGKYSELLGDFRDLADEQKAIGDKIKETLDKLARGGAEAKDAQSQIDKLIARQSELNQKLAEMAGRMDKFVRDKPLYDIEKDLQQTLTQKAADMRASLAQSNGALQDAAKQTAADPASQEKQLQALAGLQAQSEKQLAQLGHSQHDAQDKILPPLQDAGKMNAIINDLNQFKELYEAQAAAAEQTKTLENAPNLSETDRLALKQLAGTERQIEQALPQIAANLREHAKAARTVFPHAAESARDFALAMEHADLSGLAGRAATTMLAGRGPESYASADKLRQEMARFFVDTQPGGSMCSEMDAYLRLFRNLNPGDTFKQMAQGHKPAIGQGMAGTGAQGQGGLDGYAASAEQSLGMLGGETFAGQSPHSGNGGHGQASTAGPGDITRFDKADVLSGVQNANRATSGVETENTVEAYRDAIDAYFNTITK